MGGVAPTQVQHARFHSAMGQPMALNRPQAAVPTWLDGRFGEQEQITVTEFAESVRSRATRSHHPRTLRVTGSGPRPRPGGRPGIGSSAIPAVWPWSTGDLVVASPQVLDERSGLRAPPVGQQTRSRRSTVSPTRERPHAQSTQTSVYPGSLAYRHPQGRRRSGRAFRRPTGSRSASASPADLVLSLSGPPPMPVRWLVGGTRLLPTGGGRAVRRSSLMGGSLVAGWSPCALGIRLG